MSPGTFVASLCSIPLICFGNLELFYNPGPILGPATLPNAAKSTTVITTTSTAVIVLVVGERMVVCLQPGCRFEYTLLHYQHGCASDGWDPELHHGLFERAGSRSLSSAASSRPAGQ